MQFIDEAKIFVSSGKGGNGCTSFRREANVPRGGPNGGNGGRGGNIVFRAQKDLNTLIDFRFTQHFKAKSGDHGKGGLKDGKSGEDITVTVPVGTQIYAEDGKTMLFDVLDENFEKVFLKGGNGGFGNTHFKTSTNRAPRRSTPGWEGEEMWLWLKLKLLSDVGMVGLPNAGKSTFVASTTRAKPKIADYPFTTLKPKLGVCYVDEKEFVVSDIPGLIEGASEGHGLGHRFLKHIERCRVILHLIDITDDKSVQNYRNIRAELEKYSPELAEKKEIIALNKSDALGEEFSKEIQQEFDNELGIKSHLISSVTKYGIEKLLRELLEIVEFEKQKESELLFSVNQDHELEQDNNEDEPEELNYNEV